MYFIAVIIFLLGIMFISLGQISSDKVKDINALLADERNIQETKGKVPVTIIYDKRLPSKHFVKELNPLEVNKNSRIGYTIIGIFIVAVNFK